MGFNAERGSRFDGCAELLATTGADVCLLSEVDRGMARSGQRHVAQDLAAALGHQYAFGVEFVELGLGSPAEQELHPGESNDVGHHGGALTSSARLIDPKVVRLETRGYWYDPARGEPRIGGRIAVVAGVEVAGTEVLMASVHLHSHGGPDERAEELAAVIDALERRSPGGPAVIGGDLNTHTFQAEDLDDVDALVAGVAAHPDRLVDPILHEPLFDLARDRGFEWASSNPSGVTTCRGARGTALRLDWFLTRGVEASDPAVIPAVDGHGRFVSDHDALAVTIGPPGTDGQVNG